MGDTAIAPPPPDAVQTSTAQGQANVATSTANTALANANVYTPEGSSTFAQTGTQAITEPDGSISYVPTYTNQQTLSPGQQKLYNQQVQLGQAENTGALALVNNAQSAIQTPISPIAPLNTNVSSLASGIQQSVANNGNQIQTSIPNNANQIQTSVANNAGQIGTGFNNYNGGILASLGNTDNSAAVNQTIQAQLGLLQPTVNQQNEQLASQLAAQGITPGSPAYNEAMRVQGVNVNNLGLQAVGLGDQEQQALYGEQLSSGQFQNSADAQMYGQAMGATQAQNAALGQQFGQNVTAGSFANQALGQQFGQNLAAGTFGNSALGQQFQQGLQSGQFVNAANAQDYNQQMGAAGFNNQAIGQDLSQQAAVQNQSINELSALAHGGQVSQPTFQPFQSSPSEAAPISQDTYASANLAEQNYMSQLQAQSADMGALFGLGGAALKAIPAISDPDLKDDHGVVGMLADLPVHEFSYSGDGTHLLGFMADEVERKVPDAVHRMKNGYRAVDYLKVLANA